MHERIKRLFTVWRLVTFVHGLAWLIYGALNYHISDWDIGVSLLMAGSTFLTAEWSAEVLWQRRWKLWPLAALYTWLSVDGVYVFWHTLAGNRMLRAEQWPASLCLYYLCGFIWLFGRRKDRSW
jgi:hypothetical protein